MSHCVRKVIGNAYIIEQLACDECPLPVAGNLVLWGSGCIWESFGFPSTVRGCHSGFIYVDLNISGASDCIDLK